MVDKPQMLIQIETANALRVCDVVRWQTTHLMYQGKEAATVVLGQAERNCLESFFETTGELTRLFGLEVKIDGDVGVRVG